MDGDSKPTSCSSRCLGFFDSFFSSLQLHDVLNAASLLPYSGSVERDMSHEVVKIWC